MLDGVNQYITLVGHNDGLGKDDGVEPYDPNIRHIGITSWFVDAKTVGNPMPRSAVFIAACNSGRAVDKDGLAPTTFALLEDAYLEGGAEVYVGAHGTTRLGYLSVASAWFWESFIHDRAPASQPCALLEAQEPDAEKGGELRCAFQSEASQSLYLGHHELLASDFVGESVGRSYPALPEDVWVTAPNTGSPSSSSGFTGVSTLLTQASIEEAEDDAAAWLKTAYASGLTYNELSQRICPLPGQTVSFSANVQVALKPWISCNTSQNNWVVARVDDEELSPTSLSFMQWSDFGISGNTTQCASGWMPWTGYGEAPTSEDADPERLQWLTFATGGWDAEEFYMMLDHVEMTVH